MVAIDTATSAAQRHSREGSRSSRRAWRTGWSSCLASVNAGAQFSLTVTVVDAYGNVVTGYRGTISFSSSDRTARLPRNCTFTVSDVGVHTFTGLVLKKRGRQTITVTDTLVVPPDDHRVN